MFLEERFLTDLLEPVTAFEIVPSPVGGGSWERGEGGSWSEVGVVDEDVVEDEVEDAAFDSISSRMRRVYVTR